MGVDENVVKGKETLRGECTRRTERRVTWFRKVGVHREERVGGLDG